MKSLFEITINVVDRAANCYVNQDYDVNAPFWETLYGQYSDDPYDVGMLPWSYYFDYDDC